MDHGNLYYLKLAEPLADADAWRWCWNTNRERDLGGIPRYRHEIE